MSILCFLGATSGHTPFVASPHTSPMQKFKACPLSLFVLAKRITHFSPCFSSLRVLSISTRPGREGSTNQHPQCKADKICVTLQVCLSLSQQRGDFVWWGWWQERSCLDNGSALSSGQTGKVAVEQGKGPAHLPKESLLASPITQQGR